MKRYHKVYAALLAILLILVLGACTSPNNVSDSYTKENTIPRENVTPNTTGSSVPDAIAQKDNRAEIQIHYIDVGQADSILIQLADGRTVLIDGGNRGDAEIIDHYLQAQKVATIDFLIATHPHEDHIGALPDIVRNYKVSAVYMPKITANTKVFEDLLKEIKAKGLKINTAAAGAKLIDSNGLQLTMLAPNEAVYDETNEYSAVLKLSYGNTSFLFTGDAEAVSEGEMLKRSMDLHADVLKVGHHGGRTSTTAAFLKQVSPKYAIISVGKDNDYGHPHQETLERLQAADVQVLRTDEQGSIVAASDGEKISFNKAPVAANSSKPRASLNQYIGNKNSKIFHKPNCTSLPKAENQVKLLSREAALQGGFEPCKICKP